jgi:hypothetical protein
MSTPFVGMIAGMALSFMGRWAEGGGSVRDVRDASERSRR